ncbi:MULTISPECIES: nitroreductase family protein [unclassified Acinetobacter]|uniref:nitroreductase family protein n=1 Tax=unclassified Acinetobacter TaxID=196816 RepID=UPI002934FCFF|nr:MULTISPECIES: nitroreductase family protein [unclassified Acinetobacter]WOE31603.1 nitroreductase family protein [Acinetobacter sp. SAAs470]WOE37068.1 nitroreductase family protein [Acinetobacter sp. SAAs474]
MSNSTTEKQRYYEPAPIDIDIDNFRKVIESRRSVRKFTDKAIPNDVLDACLDLALLAPNSSNLQPWTFYVVQQADNKKKLVKACLGQLAAKTAAELIVCVARTDRIDEMAAKNLSAFPFPEVPAAVKKYYKIIPYNYKTGYFNAFGHFKKLAFGVARTLDKQLPVTAFNPADAKLWASKTTALACENLVLALRAYGFDSCMMEGFDEPLIRQLLNLNDQQYPVMVIAAGERAKDGVFFPQYRFDRDLFIQKL